jgi:transcriptional regulator with PAS, ATPase and Fis domain
MQCKILEDMAALVVDAMDLRLNRETVLDELNNRRAENTELDSGRDQIQQIVDSMPSAVFAIDQNLNFRIVNKKLEAWYDAATSDLIGKPFEQYAEPATFKTVLPYIKRALAARF